MSKQLIELVLPRLARPLHRQLKRYRAGTWDEAQFTTGFEKLLRQQHTWLTEHGVTDAEAALTIHAAVLILSRPGLAAEAEEQSLPLEVVEFRAVKEAAGDVAENYGVPTEQALRVISKLIARYGD